MKTYSDSGITAIVTNSKFKIEIPIAGLVNGFNRSPNNFSDVRVRSGKEIEFAEIIAEKIIYNADTENGETLVMDMFEAAFEDVFEGYDYDDQIFDYHEDEENNGEGIDNCE